MQEERVGEEAEVEVDAETKQRTKEDERRVLKAKLDAQFRHGKIMLVFAVAAFFFHWLNRGHPSTRIVGPRWNMLWGGDWNELMRNEMIRKVRHEQSELFYLQREAALAQDPLADVCRLQPVCEEEIAAGRCVGEEACLEMRDEVSSMLADALANRVDRLKREAELTLAVERAQAELTAAALLEQDKRDEV